MPDVPLPEPGQLVRVRDRHWVVTSVVPSSLPPDVLAATDRGPSLVVQEMLLRHRAHTVLVVCPASLQLKWRDEMHDRFGLDFHIVDSEAVKLLRRERGVGANVWTHFPRLIVSIDWLKRPRAMALLDEVLPHDASVYPRKFDLLIVDEVHQCAPAGRGAYATDSLRTKALRRIGPHFEHRLFLSATPHNGEFLRERVPDAVGQRTPRLVRRPVDQA